MAGKKKKKKIKMADKIVRSVTVAGGQEVNFLHFSGNFHKESVTYFTLVNYLFLWIICDTSFSQPKIKHVQIFDGNAKQQASVALHKNIHRF